MPSLQFRAAHLAAAFGAAAAVTLAACSSSPSSTPPPPTSPPATSSSAPANSGAEPTTGAAAIAAIKANWATFFDISTPLARRLALLQDGQALAAVISAQAKLPLAQGSSAKATKVTLTGSGQAAVTYDILLNGKVALARQSGVAVYQNGVWKVGLASFCNLLKLEAAVSTVHIPAACPK